MQQLRVMARYGGFNHCITTINLDAKKAQLDEDVGKLRELNKKLEEECVLEVADNTKLKGEFK